MNEYNNESNSVPVTPYKASGNLNTAIGNPQVNINDTMNVNIQSMATNSVPVQNPYDSNIVEPVQNQNTNINVTSIPTNNIKATPVEVSKPTPVYTNQNVNNSVVNNQNSENMQRTYVSIDNKPKKKKLSISLGPEFKIGLLIIVILLVFVLFLPMISDFFNGY